MTDTRPRTLPTVTVAALLAEPELARRPLVDVRTPPEFAEDHLPGAINLPVLSAAERVLVGTLHRQAGAFEANLRGAALVSANIAAMLSGPLAAKPRDWSPVIYCWRGGTRSWSLATVLGRIGWRVAVIDGGYRAWREQLVAGIDHAVRALRFRVLIGPTGTGKTRLLGELARQGHQTLDLEALACHRGSVLGPVPGTEQPSQKAFDSRLFAALRGFDPARPVWVESESRKIGRLHLSDAVIGAIRGAACVRVDAALPTRIALLRGDYAHLEQPCSPLAAQLERLAALHPDRRVAGWRALTAAGQWQTLVEALLTQHYDPAYQRSIQRNFAAADAAPRVTLSAATPAAIRAAAAAIAAAGDGSTGPVEGLPPETAAAAPSRVS
ncbi:MAG: tRNA 2-selenouridine(34) synthase MnmH [Lautropia sp.]